MRVIVIGAGLVGLAIAWRLNSVGARVTLVDPAPASGATHAAAGMLAPVAETYYQEEALGRLGLASAARYSAFVDEVAGALGRDRAGVGYLATRTLIVGADSADRGSLSDLHDLSVALGLPSRRITTREARRLEPLLGPGISSAFLADGDHQVDPRTLAAALLEALAARGVEFVAGRVTRVSDGATGVALADGSTLAADAVVVANAVGAREIGGLGVDLRVRPIYGDVLRLDAPQSLRGLVSGTIRALVAGRPAYLVPRADGSLVLGATSREDGNPNVSVGGVHELLRDAIRILPALAEFALLESVARARPGTPDNAPLLGRLPVDALIAATGTYRNGILLAPAVADTVAHLLGFDVEPPEADLTAFDPARFGGPSSARADTGARAHSAPVRPRRAASTASPSVAPASSAAPAPASTAAPAPASTAATPAAPPVTASTSPTPTRETP